jgi:hypothetical protein
MNSQNGGQTAPHFCFSFERNPMNWRFLLVTMLLLISGCFEPPRITIVNKLESRNIEYVYISSSTEDEWGLNSIPDYKVLLPGESVDVTVVPDTFDIQVVDQNGDTYTKWELEIGENGYLWEVTPSDIDL